MNELPPLKIFPHPDDIIIDWRSGDVRIEGPVNIQDENDWKQHQSLREQFVKEVDLLRQELFSKPKKRRDIEQEISELNRKIEIYDTLWPTEEIRRQLHFDKVARMKNLGLLE